MEKRNRILVVDQSWVFGQVEPLIMGPRPQTDTLLQLVNNERKFSILHKLEQGKQYSWEE